MAVTAFECPGCGANLNPAPGHATVTCKYCQTTSRVAAQPTASSWGGQSHADAARALETHANAAKGARKLILASTLGTVVIGVGVAGMAAFNASGSGPSGGSIVTPSATPAAAMDPASAAEAALMGRLDATVRTCINRLDDRILSSRARYRDWVDDDEGPKANSRHIRGLYTFSDPSDCAEAVAAASALVPRRGAMDEAAQEYVTAVTDLHAIVEEAQRYYDRGDYQDDAMARGQELHGPLTSGFNRFLVAREALIAQVDQAFEEALSAREAALAPTDTRGRLRYDTMRAALAIARAANVHWQEVGSIDHESLRAKAEGYQRQVDQLATQLTEDEREAQRYVQGSQALAQAAKELARRAERGGGWSTGERMTLRAGAGSHWMVEGSPGAVLAKYGELLRSETSPPLRYIAPTALLSDGY